MTALGCLPLLEQIWNQGEKRDLAWSFPAFRKLTQMGGGGHRSPWGKAVPHVGMAPGCHQVFTQGVNPGLEGGKFK